MISNASISLAHYMLPEDRAPVRATFYSRWVHLQLWTCVCGSLFLSSWNVTVSGAVNHVCYFLSLDTCFLTTRLYFNFWSFLPLSSLFLFILFFATAVVRPVRRPNSVVVFSSFLWRLLKDEGAFKLCMNFTTMISMLWLFGTATWWPSLARLHRSVSETC